MKQVYPIRLTAETIEALHKEGERLNMNPTALARRIIENYFRVTISYAAQFIRDDAPGLKDV